MPEWFEKWKEGVAYVVVALISSVVTMVFRLGGIIAKLGQLEQNVSELKDQLDEHQKEDDRNFNAVNEKLDEWKTPLVETAEATKWIKTTLETDRSYVHERIAEQDARNREATRIYEKKIEELEASVKAMEAEKSVVRRRTK